MRSLVGALSCRMTKEIKCNVKTEHYKSEYYKSMCLLINQLQDLSWSVYIKISNEQSNSLIAKLFALGKSRVGG